MKTTLLSAIRNDRRFTIEQRLDQPKFKFSGWWYMLDNKTNRMVRHKRLENILHEYIKFYKVKMFFKWVITMAAAGLVILAVLGLTGCQKETIQPVKSKGADLMQCEVISNTGETSVIVENLTDRKLILKFVNDMDTLADGTFRIGIVFDKVISDDYVITATSKGTNQLSITKNGYDIYRSVKKEKNKYILPK